MMDDDEDDPRIVDFNSFKLHRKIGAINSWLVVDIPTELKRKRREAHEWADELWPDWEVAYVNPENWLFVNDKYTKGE